MLHEPAGIKRNPNEVIDLFAYDSYPYPSHLDINFKRAQKLHFKINVEIGGEGLYKETLNYMFEIIFNWCDKHLLFNRYRLFPVD